MKTNSGMKMASLAGCCSGLQPMRTTLVEARNFKWLPMLKRGASLSAAAKRKTNVRNGGKQSNKPNGASGPALPPPGKDGWLWAYALDGTGGGQPLPEFDPMAARMVTARWPAGRDQHRNDSIESQGARKADDGGGERGLKHSSHKPGEQASKSGSGPSAVLSDSPSHSPANGIALDGVYTGCWVHLDLSKPASYGWLECLSSTGAAEPLSLSRRDGVLDANETPRCYVQRTRAARACLGAAANCGQSGRHNDDGSTRSALGGRDRCHECFDCDESDGRLECNDCNGRAGHDGDVVAITLYLRAMLFESVQLSSVSGALSTNSLRLRLSHQGLITARHHHADSEPQHPELQLSLLHGNGARSCSELFAQIVEIIVDHCEPPVKKLDASIFGLRAKLQRREEQRHRLGAADLIRLRKDLAPLRQDAIRLMRYLQPQLDAIDTLLRLSADEESRRNSRKQQAQQSLRALAERLLHQAHAEHPNNHRGCQKGGEQQGDNYRESRAQQAGTASQASPTVWRQPCRQNATLLAPMDVSRVREASFRLTSLLSAIRTVQDTGHALHHESLELSAEMRQVSDGWMLRIGLAISLLGAVSVALTIADILDKHGVIDMGHLLRRNLGVKERVGSVSTEQTSA